MGTRVETSARAKRDLKFLPRVLIDNCCRLIESYHDIHGYGCLADILWRAEAREFVEVNDDLHALFAKASKTRSAKKANAIYLSIAGALLAVEILADDLFGWSQEFPSARKKAIGLMHEFLPVSRTRLRDIYLCERNFIRAPSSALINAVLHPPVRVSAPHIGLYADLETGHAAGGLVAAAGALAKAG